MRNLACIRPRTVSTESSNAGQEAPHSSSSNLHSHGCSRLRSACLCSAATSRNYRPKVDAAEVGAEQQVPSGSFVLRGAGATFPSLLYKRWFTVYHDNHPDTFVKYAAVGSGEGVHRFIGKDVAADEQVDFGASDAAMSDAQLAAADNSALMVPATAGCVVLAYNLPGFNGELKLSRKAYAGIFLGEITNWNDPVIAQSNPGVKLPKLTIVTAVRQDGSGTTYAFTRNLDAVTSIGAASSAQPPW